MKKLIPLIFLLLLIPLVAAQNETAGKGICVHYFYRPGCHFCAQAEPYIEGLKQNYSINLYKYNVQNPVDYKVYDELCGMENIPLEERGVPLVAVGDKILVGLNQIQNNLEPEIRRLQNSTDYKCILEKYCTQANHTAEGTEPAINITKVTLPLITIAAVADSINPCAIGVLVFLLSFLFLSSNQNVKRTLVIAFLYIFTVYIVYLSAGIGILAFISKLSFLHLVSRIFAGIIVIAGVINIKDAFNEKKGMFAIPERAKPLIERWVYRVSIPAAIILGIIVAAVELPCTGGMYMAILALLANTATKTQAFWYLLYYNFIFVLPLLIITFLFIAGLEGKTMHEWIERHKKKAKLAAGIILVALGLILLFL